MLVLAIVLAIVGAAAGYGASTVITKKKMGSVELAAEKELKNGSVKPVQRQTRLPTRRAAMSPSAAKRSKKSKLG